MSALCEQLGIQHPIIQAPMAGGSTTPALVAAVSNAGGLGSFGFAYSSAAQIARDCAAYRQLSDRPFNANLFVFRETQVASDADQDAVCQAFVQQGLLERVGLQALPHAQAPFYPDPQAQLEQVLAEKPAVVTFHFDLPDADVIAKVKASGAVLGVSATCEADALDYCQRGADFIVAQGIEAGGHRGTKTHAQEDHEMTTQALVAQLHSSLPVPVVAAGGIMHGRDMAEMLRLGAAAVQMGTAFLTTDESGVSGLYRQAVDTFSERPTRYTRAFSGRRAQGIDNLLMQKMAQTKVLPFPQQNTFTGPLRAAAGKKADMELMSLWAGKHFAKARAVSVSALMTALIEEATATPSGEN